jgi:hypothetical protein
MFERNLFQAISTSTHTPNFTLMYHAALHIATTNKTIININHHSLDNDHDSNNNGTTISGPVDVPVLVPNDEWGCVSSQEHGMPDVSFEPW